VSGPRKRGRETAADMVRSLAVVMVLVLGAFWLAQPPDSDKQEIRVIDPQSEVQSYLRAVPQGKVPGNLPAQWRPTVAVYEPDPHRLRIGYNTPRGEYAEYWASAGDADAFLAEATGRGERLDPVDVAGAQWQQVRDEDGSLSISRGAEGTMIVVGGLRATATLDELRVLAASIGLAPARR
jgi:hypothetical protein